MSEFTPGPWEVPYAQEDCITTKEDILGNLICEAPKSESFPKSYDNWKANARLIAAAPELYQMLHDITDNPTKLEWYNKAIKLLNRIDHV